MPDFIPRQDAELVNWSRNLANKIAVDPSRYLLTPEMVANYIALDQSFADAYRLAVAPTTRGPSAVSRKDSARTSLVEAARIICRKVRAVMDLSSTDFISLGLKVRKTTYTRTKPPTGAPNVCILSTRGRTIDIILTDDESPHRIAKPANIHCANIFAFVGETPPATLFGWALIGQASRTRFKIELPPYATPGSKVFVTAAWQNTRGKMGRCGLPGSTHVSFALPKRAA